MNTSHERQAAYPLVSITQAQELGQAINSGNVAAVTACRVRIAVASGNSTIVSRALLEHCGIRAQVRTVGRAVYVEVQDHHAFTSILRMLRGSFDVVAVQATDGRLGLKAFLV